MTLGTLVRRNLAHRKTRSALLCIAIAAAFLLFGLLAAMQRNFSASDSLQSQSRLIVANRVGFTQPLPMSYVRAVREEPGVAQVSFHNITAGYFREERNLFLILAIDPSSYFKLYPEYALPAADRAAFAADRNSILVGRSLAERFKWKTGDVIPVRALRRFPGEGRLTGSYRIAGIFAGDDPSTGTGLALAHWSTFNETREAERDTVGNIVISSADPSKTDDLVGRIDGRFANAPVRTRTSTEQEFSRAMVAQLGNITLMVATVVGAAFFTILLIVASAMATAVRERRKEIGVLRSLGFSGVQVSTLIVGEAMILSLFGGALGLLLASSVVKGLRPLQNGAFARMEITPSAILLSVVLMVAVGVIGAAVPVAQTLRLNVVNALSRRDA